ncbi:MAG: RNA 2',3'-cyclic phosphodiesterase [Infirmifilum sp.]
MSLVRCFVAVDVEDPQVVSRVVSFQKQLKATGASLKPVEPENLHLTLRFIGEVPQEVVERIRQVLEGVDFEPFTVRFAGVGAFPHARRPRVVWIGVEEGAMELAELSAKVNNALSKLKLPKPEEGFTPHLTVARVKGGVGSLPQLIQSAGHVEFGSITVDRIRLKRSTLTPRGPIYATLFEKPARG